MHARRSLTVAEAADLMSTSKNIIVRLLETGELQGHYLRREKRVYVASLIDYQDRHAIVPRLSLPAPAERPRRRYQGPTEAALALKEFGI